MINHPIQSAQTIPRQPLCSICCVYFKYMRLGEEKVHLSIRYLCKCYYGTYIAAGAVRLRSSRSRPRWNWQCGAARGALSRHKFVVAIAASSRTLPNTPAITLEPTSLLSSPESPTSEGIPCPLLKSQGCWPGRTPSRMALRGGCRIACHSATCLLVC